MNDLLQDAADRSIRYLDALPRRGVAPTPKAVENLRGFEEPLPVEPTDPQKVLAMLDDLGSPSTIA